MVHRAHSWSSLGRAEPKELGIRHPLCAIVLAERTVVEKYHCSMCTELGYVYVGNKEKILLIINWGFGAFLFG